MSIRKAIRELTEGVWKKTPEGYEGVFGGHTAKLYKGAGRRKSAWFLDFKGRTIEMPRRGSFDHAEGAIERILGQ